MALNNLEVSSEFILRIKGDIESKTERMFSKPEDKEKVKTALGDLHEISKRFKQTLDVWLCCLIITYLHSFAWNNFASLYNQEYAQR